MAQPRIFISYRRKPSAMLATLLARELKPRGIDAFVDTRRTDGGGPFPDRLLRAIEAADVFVCLLGEDTLDSEWVRREIQHAHNLGKILIPVFQERYAPPAEPADPDGYVHALLQSDGVHVMDVKNIYVDQAIDTLATMIVNSVPRRGPRWRFLAGLGVLAVTLVILAVLVLANVLRPQSTPGVPDAAQAAQTLTAAAETRAALAGPTGTAEAVLATSDPSWPLTEAAYTEGAMTLDAGLALSATARGFRPTPTTTPSITPYFPTALPSPIPFGTSSTPSAGSQNAESALQRAATFQGGNADWTPHIEAFTFTNGLTLELALVPAGCFQMGNDPEAGEGAADGGPQCFDAPFWIGRTEVTNAHYRACYDMGACDRAPLDSGPDFNGPDWPVMGVDWAMAQQYVAWLSATSGVPFRLPTEAEWEYAARGPDNLVFPWGDAFDGARLSFCDIQCDCNGRDGSTDDGYALTAPVGIYSPAGDSWVGAADLAGNVWDGRPACSSPIPTIRRTGGSSLTLLANG